MSTKQVIIVCESLKRFNISVGKLAVQIAHGAVEGFRLVLNKAPKVAQQWLIEGQKKIIVVVPNEEELIAKYEIAKKLGIPAVLIRDAGLTELPPGTLTVCVLGPWFSKIVDKVTGSLKLLKNW